MRENAIQLKSNEQENAQENFDAHELAQAIELFEDLVTEKEDRVDRLGLTGNVDENRIRVAACHKIHLYKTKCPIVYRTGDMFHAVQVTGAPPLSVLGASPPGGWRDVSR